MSLTGKLTAAPFVSSSRSACSRAQYSTQVALGSMLAARRPSREARAKFECASRSAHSDDPCGLRM